VSTLSQPPKTKLQKAIQKAGLDREISSCVYELNGDICVVINEKYWHDMDKVRRLSNRLSVLADFIDKITEREK